MADARQASFPEDVSSRFAFLVKDFGFSGPEYSESVYVSYRLELWEIWSVLEMRNKTVDTYVHYDTNGGGQPRSASVWSLVRSARVRGAGQQRTSGLTRAGVQKSLSAQAGALRLLMPRLLAEDGSAVFD
jgi:hypothetical protein